MESRAKSLESSLTPLGPIQVPTTQREKKIHYMLENKLETRNLVKKVLKYFQQKTNYSSYYTKNRALNTMLYD